MGGLAVIFPGQGTQAVGMGTPWRAHAAWELVERAETALGEPLGRLLVDDDADLTRTREAQLAVFLTALMAWTSARPTLPEPIAFAGHSLGQMTALVASGALSVEDGIQLVASRAEFTQVAADATPGRMIALLGATIEQAEAACAAAPEACWLANDNAPGQVVVAGTPEGTDVATEAAKAAGVRKAMPLPVGGAFHTPLMAPACEPFAAVLATTTISPPTAPVVSNGDAQPYADGEGWRTRLVDHLVNPVRWRSSMETLVTLGADELAEVGPSGTLAAMAKRTVPDVPVRTIDSPVED